MISEQKVINWLVIKSEANIKLFPSRDELTQLRLMKLLYFIQGTYLAIHGEKLFDDKIVHADYGPIAENAHKKFKRKRKINSEIDWDEAQKDFSELNNSLKISSVLNSVFNTYADVKTSKLVDITHNQRPWSSTQSGEEMGPGLLKEYFDEIVIVNE